YPFPPEKVVEFYRINYGPMSRQFASLDVEEQEKLRSELVRLWSAHNKAAAGDTTMVDAEYLEVIATRDSRVQSVPQNASIYKLSSLPASSSRRAESLASRIEEGADGLAAFAEGLSESEWRTPASGSDRRSVGAVVHHVAAVYPAEIHLARTIASGKPVLDVIWEIVSELNAKHARDHAALSKAD